MSKCFTVLFLIVSLVAWGQTAPVAAAVADSAHSHHAPFERRTISLAASIGFIDAYRNSYSVPIGFEKGNTSGFNPIYVKLDYGVAKDVSIAAAFGYDAFLYNVRQDYSGPSGAFTRYLTNNTRILSLGLIGFYHLHRFIPVRHLDPFVGIGASLNNIRYGAQPQGDSAVIAVNHTVTPYLKVGARYYITSAFSIFADAGYDQHSIFSIGASCRFFRKSSKEKRSNTPSAQ